MSLGMKIAKRRNDNIIIEDDDMRNEVPMSVKRSKTLFYLNSLL